MIAVAVTKEHEWTAAGAGRVRFGWRSSLEPLPASVLPVCGGGKLDRVGRIAGAGEHEGDGVVRGFNSISLGIPTAGFEWPARIRSSGPVNRSTGEQPQCDEFGREFHRKSSDERSDGSAD